MIPLTSFNHHIIAIATLQKRIIKHRDLKESCGTMGNNEFWRWDCIPYQAVWLRCKRSASESLPNGLLQLPAPRPKTSIQDSSFVSNFTSLLQEAASEWEYGNIYVGAFCSYNILPTNVVLLQAHCNLYCTHVCVEPFPCIPCSIYSLPNWH